MTGVCHLATPSRAVEVALRIPRRASDLHVWLRSALTLSVYDLSTVSMLTHFMAGSQIELSFWMCGSCPSTFARMCGSMMLTRQLRIDVLFLQLLMSL